MRLGSITTLTSDHSRDLLNTPNKDQLPPGFAFALRWTALGAQFGLAFSIALAAADIVSQFAPRHQRAIFFGLAGGTVALVGWKFFGWIFERVGTS
jgi:hypothetical protein